MSVFQKEIGAIFVAHGSAVAPMRYIHNAVGNISEIERTDLMEESPSRCMSLEKYGRMVKAFKRPNPVLILGMSEWTNHYLEDYLESGPGDLDALYFAGGGFINYVYGYPRPVITCLVTSSLDLLDPVLAIKGANCEKRNTVQMVVVYGQEGGHMGRKVYESLIRRFPNLLAPNFLCFKVMDDKAAKLIASRIRRLV